MFDNLLRCQEDGEIIEMDDHMAFKNHWGHNFEQPVHLNWIEKIIWRKKIKNQKKK